MAEIIDVANYLFRVRSVSLTEEDKIKSGWIFNRLLSKKYPEQSSLLNHKNQDKGLVIDMWFHFLKGEPYPKWLWSKTTQEKKSLKLDEYKYFYNQYDLNIRDVDWLISRNPDIIEEELKYFNKKQKAK